MCNAQQHLWVPLGRGNLDSTNNNLLFRWSNDIQGTVPARMALFSSRLCMVLEDST